ncbi:MAG: cytochrome c3 family protein [Proteobacteria bacterium]|nr:cytochrome c3 family protein [Pseudomonadota bacterium]
MVPALILVATLLPASQSVAAIAGSNHDFSGDGWSGGQICEVCHTPHNSDTTVENAPLWDHELTTQVFVPYASPTLDATDVGQPGGASKLCLSCHDGSVALDSFGGTTGTIFMTGNDAVGTGGQLADDHPISFTYDTALATLDGGLHDPATTGSGLGSTIADDMLFASAMECSSCHDVHNADGHAQLLRVSNAGSALCLTCHSK